MTGNRHATPLNRFEHALMYVQLCTEELASAFDALPEDQQQQFAGALLKLRTLPRGEKFARVPAGRLIRV